MHYIQINTNMNEQARGDTRSRVKLRPPRDGHRAALPPNPRRPVVPTRALPPMNADKRTQNDFHLSKQDVQHRRFRKGVTSAQETA